MHELKIDPLKSSLRDALGVASNGQQQCSL